MRKTVNSTATEVIKHLFEIHPSYSSLPPEFIILDDFDVMRILNISKRKLAQLRADRLIEFHPTGKTKHKLNKVQLLLDAKNKGRRAGKIYYTLKGVIDYVMTTTVTPIFNHVNF